ncbi:HEPN domain-containing protein [bacterium]|nr:HEPN domain-containing protein [candidate division CSSED10-310 bacterium]
MLLTNPREWLKQAEYDLETASYMFDGKRFFYAVFMCHLALEKALKGLYAQVSGTIPPKTHNLVYLTEKAGIKPPENLSEFMHQLNGVSIPTRYPDDLENLKSNFTRDRTADLLEKSKECLAWLTQQLKE